MKAKVSKLNNAYLTKKIEISQLKNCQSSSKLKYLNETFDTFLKKTVSSDKTKQGHFLVLQPHQ